MVHQALGDHHILHTAAHLAANDDAAMAFVQQAVADNGVLTALFQLHAKEYLAGLHGNAVVAHMDVHADDADILAAFGVDAVGVGGIVGVVDVEVQQVKVLDKDGVDRPRIAVLHRDAVQADVLAVHSSHSAGPPCDALDLGRYPPVAVLGIAVQRALAGHNDIVHLRDVQQTRKAVQRVALPAGQVVFIHLVLAGDHAGQDGVVGAVIVAQQHSALFKIEGGVAFQEQAAGAVAACGHVHCAALGAGGKSRLQLEGVVRGAVSHQTVAGSIHKEGLGLGGKGAGQAFALGLHTHRVLSTGQQGEQGEHVGLAGFVDGLSVQGNGERVGRTIAQAVFQLENSAARHGTNKRQIHGRTS